MLNPYLCRQNIFCKALASSSSSLAVLQGPLAAFEPAVPAAKKRVHIVLPEKATAKAAAAHEPAGAHARPM